MEREKFIRSFIAFLFIALVVSNVLSGCSQVNSVVGNRELLNNLNINNLDSNNLNLSDFNNRLENNLEGRSLSSSTNKLQVSDIQNRLPLVKIKSNESIIGYNQEVTFLAEAFDADGDELIFNWVVNHGEILQKNSNMLKWRSPSYDTDVEIVCEVNDKKGGTKKDSIKFSVVGSQILKIKLEISKESIYVITRYSQNANLPNNNDIFVPLPNANIKIPALNINTITDNNGEVTIKLERSNSIATQSDVFIRFLDFEVVYSLPMNIKNSVIFDNIKFLPGYSNVSIALAKGDSFLHKHGGIEIRVGEFGSKDVINSNAISDVLVQVDSNQVYLRNGYAFISSLGNANHNQVRINKNGYFPISLENVRTYFDYVTLINAKLFNQNLHLSVEPIISWMRPFYGETNVSLVGPFYIGFGQAMEKNTIFDDFELAFQEGKNQVTILKGHDIKRLFEISWENDFTLKLVPKQPLVALTKYNLSLIRWNSRTADGRLLKNYSGLFSNFVTADDSTPKVISISPKNGEKDVSRSGPFEIRFNQAMNTSSINNKLKIKITKVDSKTTIELDEKSIYSYFRVQWSNGDTTISLVPKAMLPANTTFLVQIIEVNLTSKTGKKVEDLSNIWTQFTTGLL